MRKPLSLYIIPISLLSLVLLFQNCSPNSTGGGDSSEQLAISPCQDMKSIFEKTYRPFLQTNCNNCHRSGGTGKGAFADDSSETSWSSFELAGYSRVSDFAVNPGHNSPFTGPQHEETMEKFRQNWIAGLEEQVRCKTAGAFPDDNDIGLRFITSEKRIGIAKVGESKNLEWQLSSELSADPGLTLPQLPGAVLSVKVEVVEVLGQIAYYVSEPRIKNSQVDLYINSLRTKINGSYIPGETTFTFVEKSIYKNTDTLLSAGTMIALGLNNQDDTLQISLGKIATPKLPPPDLGPKVSFALKSQQKIEKGIATIEVKLSKAPTQAVVVQIEFDKSTRGRLRRSARDEDEPYDHFDWDFTLGAIATPASNRTLTFIPGNELTQSFDLLISDDQRKETEEKAVLSIINIENGEAGENTKHTVNITDNDAAPSNPFIKTFSELMTKNGVLNQRCLECHNTVRKEGGYDLTDYSSMTSVAKKILVPGNPLASQMYQRLRLEGAGRMPLDQALDAKDQREIENWILDGAKNN